MIAKPEPGDAFSRESVSYLFAFSPGPLVQVLRFKRQKMYSHPAGSELTQVRQNLRLDEWLFHTKITEIHHPHSNTDSTVYIKIVYEHECDVLTATQPKTTPP